eukprot:Skav225428  [mRNA]  locus=scaffold680:306579:309809:- [translate_table: standard]
MAGGFWVKSHAFLCLSQDCPFDEEEHQLLERRRELKALLIASRQRADALASAIDAQVDEEKERMQVIDELSHHCTELQNAQDSEHRQQELLRELEKTLGGEHRGDTNGCHIE